MGHAQSASNTRACRFRSSLSVDGVVFLYPSCILHLGLLHSSLSRMLTLGFVVLRGV